MANVPVTEVVQVDAALDALDDPTSSQVWDAVEEFSDTAIAVSAARRSLSSSGGSQPGALCSADLLFTEEETVGTYTATLDVEAGTVVLDVLVYLLAWPWADPNMDNVVLTVGDGDDAGGYFSDLGLTNANHISYDPTSPDADSWFLSSRQYGAGMFQQLAYSTDPNGSVVSGPGRRYVTADTITATIVPTGAAGTGVVLVKVLYLAPVTAVAAGFVETP